MRVALGWLFAWKHSRADMEIHGKLSQIIWRWTGLFLILSFGVHNGSMADFICDPISSSVQMLSDDYILSGVAKEVSSEIGQLNCTRQIIHSASSFLRFEVTYFSLGGHDPCGLHDERLEILFYNDFLKIVSTVVWCGQSYGPLIETRHNVTFVYYPASDRQFGRFNIKFSLVQRFCQNGVSSLQVGPQPLYVYSPGYPGPYTNNTECRWNLTSKFGEPISLDTYAFEVENHPTCSFDYLRFDGGSYCGKRRVRRISKSGRVMMEFVTDHLQTYNGFIIRLVEISGQHTECGMTVTLSSGPFILTLPPLRQGIINDIQCTWLLDAASDDCVVLLDISNYYTRASCMDFQTKVYDGKNDSAPLLSSGCAPQQTFQTIRSSSRYLFIDVSLEGFGNSPVNVTYMATASWKNTSPRLLYAGSASSFVWLDMATFLSTWLLLRIDLDADNDYSQCLQVSLVDTPFTPQAYDLSSLVYAYSGPDTTFMELGAGCGRETSKRVISRGTKVLLLPKVNSSVMNSSVWLVYNLSSFCTPDIIPLQSSETPAHLRSDTVENGGGYPNNAYCRWLIKPSSIYLSTQVTVDDSLLTFTCEDNITAFDYKSDYEYNKIMDWCGSQKPTLVSSLGNSILLEFLTNASVTDKGFSLTYSSIALHNACPTLTYLLVNATPQYLTSPNFPYNYPSNVDCKWLVTAVTGVVQLELVNLSIYHTSSSCSNGDFLAIYDGPDDSGPVIAKLCWSGIHDPVYTSSSDSMLLYFHSDNMFSAQGFHLRLVSSENVGFNCNKDVYVTDTAYANISSPHYPEPYPKGVDCWWRVLAPPGRVISLEVVDVDIPGCEDSAVVYDGESTESPRLHQICDDSDRVTVVSTWQCMYVSFTSNTHGKYRGFMLQLHSASESLRCDGRVIPVTASSSVTYITSPNYPNYYPPNIVCQWRVETSSYNQTIVLEILDAVLESSYSCNFDNVIIYDGYNEESPVLGKFCSRSAGSYWSKSAFIFIKFHSDSNGQFRGFKLAVQSASGVLPTGPNGDSSSENSANNIGGVVGSTIGAFLFLLVCVMAVLCLLNRHRRRNQSTCGSQPHQMRQNNYSEQGNTMFVVSPVILNQMAPPPYSGVVNAAYTADEMPPSYNTVFNSPPPPAYCQLETPPPYTEELCTSHPQSNLSNPDIGSENGMSIPSHGYCDYRNNLPNTRPGPSSMRERESAQQNIEVSYQVQNHKNILPGRQNHLVQGFESNQDRNSVSRKDSLEAIRQSLMSAPRHSLLPSRTGGHSLHSHGLPHAHSSPGIQSSPTAMTEGSTSRLYSSCLSETSTQAIPDAQGSSCVQTSDMQTSCSVQGSRSCRDQQLITQSGQEGRSTDNRESVLHHVPSAGQASHHGQDQRTVSNISRDWIKESFV